MIVKIKTLTFNDPSFIYLLCVCVCNSMQETMLREENHLLKLKVYIYIHTYIHVCINNVRVPCIYNGLRQKLKHINVIHSLISQKKLSQAPNYNTIRNIYRLNVPLITIATLILGTLLHTSNILHPCLYQIYAFINICLDFLLNPCLYPNLCIH